MFFISRNFRGFPFSIYKTVTLPAPSFMASTSTTSSLDPIGKLLSLTGERIVGEPRKRGMSPSSVCNTEELEISSDFHPIDIGHESSPSLSEVELQTPRPNRHPSGLTLRALLRAATPIELYRDEPLQMNSADHFSHTIVLDIQHIGLEEGDVLRLRQIFAQNGDRVTETSANLGKTIVSLTFQAGVGLVALSLPNSSPAEQFHTPWNPLHLVQLAMVIGFAASFMGILLRHTCPVMASNMEKTGYLSAALGFFLMMSLFLPRKDMWIGWIASAVSLVAFSFALLKSHRLGLGLGLGLGMGTAS